MSPFIDYIIIPKDKLIIEYFNGKVSLEDVIILQKELAENPNYDPNYNVIDDLRDAQFDLIKEQVIGYVDYITNNKKTIGKRNTAFVTTNPDQVVISSLFESLKKDLPINTLIVITISLALKHVNINPAKTPMILENINTLRKKNKNTPQLAD